ncbi:hypothetical protein [Noviherbaspirillum sp.]
MSETQHIDRRNAGKAPECLPSGNMREYSAFNQPENEVFADPESMFKSAD